MKNSQMKAVFFKLPKVGWLLFLALALVLLVLTAAYFNALEKETYKAIAQSPGGQSWAWSSNIGWVSFTSENCGGASPPSGCGSSSSSRAQYAVTLDANDNIEQKSYAWSSNLEWLSFDRTQTGNPPNDDIGGGSGPLAKIDSAGNLVGWARFLSYGGGWDGWVKFSGTWNNGVHRDPQNPNELTGYAWGGDVVGWLSFNCNNTGVCGSSSYKVVLGRSGPSPNFSVRLTAAPSSGEKPLNVTLTAKASNYDATKSIRYDFDCDNGQTSSVTRDPGDSDFDTATASCLYTTAGSYKAQVTATQSFSSGDATDIDVTTVLVNPPGRIEE